MLNMELAERQRLIDMYEAGHDAVIAALDGIIESGLDVREAPGEWSPRQVVHHLGDSEMNAALRIRTILADDQAVIQGYDEKEYADRLFYDRPIESSLAAFKAAREATLPILRRMSEDQWAREGTHTQYGAFGATIWLTYYGVHAHEHADQIRRAREANGQ